MSYQTITINYHSINKAAKHLFVLAYAILAASLTLFTLYLCYAIEWSGPFRDLWEFIGLIQDQLNGHWDFNALIEPYGGIHRILIPKLLFYLDYRFASGSNLLAMSVTIIFHIAACGVFIYGIVKLPKTNKEDSLLLIATILLFWFSTTQIYNLIYISDNQVVIGNSLAIFSGWIFCLYLENKQSRYLYIANAIIILACLSHSSSLMIWPAIIVVMFLLRLAKKEILIQLALAACIFALYVSGHDPLNDSSESASLLKKAITSIYSIAINAHGILRYIGLHLSSPTSREYSYSGIVISYLSIVYLCVISHRIYTKRWQPTQVELFWVTLACYGFLIAVVTACGRQIYPNSALTGRYQTLVMTYWASVMALLYIDIKKYKPSLILLAPALSLALLLPYQYKNAEEMAWLSSRVNIAHTAAITGITNIETVAATLSHPLLMDNKNLVSQYNDFLRDKKLGYFSDEAARYFLDDIANQSFPETIEISTRCRGKLLSIERFYPPSSTANNADVDLKLTGQSFIDDQPSDYVLVMDKQRKIIGLGRNHRQKAGFLPLALRNPETQQWKGFIHSTGEPDYPLTFLGKTSKGYCSLFAKTALEM